MMRGIIWIVILFTTFALDAKAQNQPILAEYVDTALQNNIVLQQRHIALDEAQYALEISRRMFYPTLGLDAQYITSSGGRSIDLPVGDMINPIYTTLNRLTQSDRFPQLDNEHINFLPANFYDAKLHVEIPIYNRELIYSKKIKTQQVRLQEIEIDIYRRDLVNEVKKAYYTYMQAREAVGIYDSIEELAREGKRINERLLENGKGLYAYVVRAENELERVKALKVEAEIQEENARRYFNFLLNRNPLAPIDYSSESEEVESLYVFAITSSLDLHAREEITALNEVVELKGNLVDIRKSAMYPSFNAMLDVGSQAEEWKWDSQSRYLMFGAQLKVPIFAWNRNRLEVQKAQLAVKQAQLDKVHALNQLEVSAAIAVNKLKASYEIYQSSGKQVETAYTYYRLIERGYKEGVNSYIEMVDARNQLSEAQIKHNIDKYKIMIAIAELERAQGNSTIN